MHIWYTWLLLLTLVVTRQEHGTKELGVLRLPFRAEMSLSTAVQKQPILPPVIPPMPSFHVPRGVNLYRRDINFDM